MASDDIIEQFLEAPISGPGIIPNGRYVTPFNISPSTSDDFPLFLRKFNLLPPRIKNIIINFSTAEFIEEKIGAAFNLSSGQKNALTLLVRDTLVGDAYVGDLPLQIQQRLSLESNKSKEVANMVVSGIFSPALADIKIVQAQKFSDRIKNPGQTKPTPDPVIASQNISGTINLRQPTPPVAPQAVPAPVRPPAPPVSPPQNRPAPQATPPTTIPRPAMPLTSPQPMQAPPRPQQQPMASAQPPRPVVAPPRPQNPTPPSAQQAIPPRPQSTQVAPPKPAIPGPDRGTFKMPPPLPNEPQANLNTSKTLNLRDLG